MKLNLKHLVVGTTAMLLVTGCTWKGSGGVSQVEISSVDVNSIGTMKKGKACHSRFLIFPTSLNATAQEAAKNGGITKIKYQEWTKTDAIIFSSDCLVVYGE